jgi:hypothetical protein
MNPMKKPNLLEQTHAAALARNTARLVELTTEIRRRMTAPYLLRELFPRTRPLYLFAHLTTMECVQ